VRNKIKEAFEAANTPQLKTRLLQAWLELGVESYVERVVIQKAVEKGDWGTLTLFLDMRFQQVNPKLLEGSSAPLSSEHWEKLAGRIEALEKALVAAEAELKSADDGSKQAETASQKTMTDLAAASKKLKEAEMLYERAKKEGDTKLEAIAAKDVVDAMPEVQRLTAQAKSFLQNSAETTRVAENAQRKVDELGTELSMLRRSSVPDIDGRMTRLAHLLVHLDADAAWQKRAMLVVGLRKYVKVVSAQAERYASMARALDTQIRREQEHYSTAIAALRDQAMQRTRLVMEIKDSRIRLEQQRDKDKTFVEQRRTQLAELETQLNKIKADVAALLAEQTSLEQELFILQREIAVTLEEVYALQDELRDKERERFSIPK
jgi:chromosome segregation ATPase